MISVLKKIVFFLLRGKTAAVHDTTKLHVLFREQYRYFRSLLTANNNCLELMAEIEQAKQGDHPFSMAFVRSHCTALSANVLKMISLLQKLNEKQYQHLLHPFQSITEQLEEILTREPAIVGKDLIITLDKLDRHDADRVGEKMANLGELRNRAGLLTPEGFVITAAATQHFFLHNDLTSEINRRLTSLNSTKLSDVYAASAAIEKLIIEAPLPADLESAILENYQNLNIGREHDMAVALRSSALGEDSRRSSFAGIYRSKLHVQSADLIRSYKEIVAGKYRTRAIMYRLQRGFRHEDVIMCVGCMVMVDGEASGVMYSRPPDDLRGEWVEITAAAGLADKVVSGQAVTERYRIDRNVESIELIVEQTTFADGLTENSKKRLLSPAQQTELASIAVRLEHHFGSPQDIEWSLGQDGKIYLLQARPLGGSPRGATVISSQGESGRGQSSNPTTRQEEEHVVLRGGLSVSPGVAFGPVKIVREESDLMDFQEGAILVVVHPLPEWAVVLPRAAAVLAETGQNAAHLATVAREFGIPALFGVAGCSSTLQENQEVTVDATGLRIYQGRREHLLDQAPPPVKLMLGSPIYNLLCEAAELITPLNLLDPTSPFFRPEECRTFHDITRFCHEKAVAEMFSFGSRHGFSERSAKQLAGESPYTWWVINLEDGFSTEHNLKDKYIHIEHIVSSPMLAIWQGMTVFPWLGPPPMNLKGFGSIVFRSTMNPNLDPAVRSNMNNRSYFLISKHFCNLSIRLGYHFALVESYASDLLTENYVSFQFKGGAADDRRRLLRIRLIGEILERYDFRVIIKADALTARLEKIEKSILLQRLTILGYLLIHTRQIDMVMGDSGMVGHYRNSILQDIEKILSTGRPATEIATQAGPELLIVDDEIEFLDVLASRLRLRNFAVRTARSCEEAIEALAVTVPQVVILDVMLPGGDGIECLKRIKAGWPKVGVIMLSGHASIQYGMRGIEFGASDYCLKPIEVDELIDRIHIAHAEMTTRQAAP